MGTSRRDFLKMGTFALTGVAVGTGLSSFSNRQNRDILGMQLYTVRDDMQKDPVGALKQLSKIGYKNVEHANYINREFYGYSPKDFKKILEDAGLKMPSGHVQFGLNDWDASKKSFTDQWKYTIEDAVIAGQSHLINPWMDEEIRTDHNKLMQLLELFNKSGELCKRSGLQFGYHNHDFEFDTHIDRKLLYDIILDKTDPDLVVQEMDIGNMYNGGGKPIDVLKKHPGRFKMMHVKDLIRSKQGEMGDSYESTVLGKGILPVKEIIDLAKRIGHTSYFIIEQESYQDQTSMECSKEDYITMKKWGL